MPKRPNPFGDNSPLQMKSHIGIKEAEMADEEKMESVYEKTKSLLFQGSRKPLHNCGTFQHSDLHFPREHPVEILRGQMRFDTQGHLYSDSSNDGMPHPPSPASMDSNSMDRGMDMSDQLLPGQCHLLPGQMTLGPSGQLQSVLKGSPRKVAFKVCHMCSEGNTAQLSRCGSCERDTCIGCLTQCCGCDGFVCKLCSRVNYDDYLERSVCYQCVS